MHICIVEHNVDFLEGMIQLLESENYKASGFRTSDDFMWRLQSLRPDVVVLDAGPHNKEPLPRIENIRSEIPDVAMVLITDHSDPVFLKKAFDSGADDLLVKPFSVRELITRFERIYRLRNPGVNSDQRLQLLPQNLEIIHGRDRVRLTRTEFEIFKYLNDSRNTFVQRENLCSLGAKRDLSSGRSLDVHILSLRKKVEPLGFKIETLRGVGYRLSH